VNWLGFGSHFLEMKDEADIQTLDGFRESDVLQKSMESFPSIESKLALVFSGLTFLPIQSFSDRATSVILRHMQEMVTDSQNYPPGLKEQYKIQMELLKNVNFPDCEVILFPFSRRQTDLTRKFITILPTLSHPWSRGTIHISSADSCDPPVIDPKCLDKEIDLDILVELFQFIRKVAHTSPFKDIVVKEVLPGQDMQASKDIREHVAKNLSTTWHTVGSLSMLPRHLGGVVDTSLKVYGTHNVRIVDLSILPLQISAHTQATAYAIAEQASDIIKQEIGGENHTEPMLM